MGMLMFLLWGLALISGLVAFVFFIIIVVHAFKVDTGQGFLCLCVPLYILYFAFVVFQHPKKTTIIAMWLGAYVLQGGLYWGGAVAGLSAAQDALEGLSVPTAQPYAPGGYPAAVSPGTPAFAPTPDAIPVAPLPAAQPIPMVPAPAAPAGPPALSPLVPINPTGP